MKKAIIWFEIVWEQGKTSPEAHITIVNDITLNNIEDVLNMRKELEEEWILTQEEIDFYMLYDENNAPEKDTYFLDYLNAKRWWLLSPKELTEYYILIDKEDFDSTRFYYLYNKSDNVRLSEKELNELSQLESEAEFPHISTEIFDRISFLHIKKNSMPNMSENDIKKYMELEEKGWLRNKEEESEFNYLASMLIDQD